MRKLYVCIAFIAILLNTGLSFAQFETSVGRAPVVGPNKYEEISPSVPNPASRAFCYNGAGPFQLNKQTLLNTALTPIGAPVTFAFPGASAWVTTTNRLYVIDQLSPFALYFVDTLTGVRTFVANCTGVPHANLTGMTWDPTTNTMYAVSTSLSASQLLTMNITTGVCTPVGGPTTVAPGVIMVNAAPGGSLFSVDIVNDNFFKWNKTTGVPTLIGPAGFNVNFGQDGHFDLSDGQYYWTAFNATAFQAQFRLVDTLNGSSTLLGTYGGQVETFGIYTLLAPVNNECVDAITVSCGSTVTGSTVTATLDGPPLSCNATSTAPDVWYKIVGNGVLNTASLCGSSYDTKIDVYTGNCGTLVCVGGNDDFCGFQSQFSWPTTAGVTYYIRVHGFAGATGNFTMTIFCPPVNDDCANAININCGQSINGTNNGASPDPGAPFCTVTTQPGVWYTFIGSGSNETVNTCAAANFDTQISVYTGTCGGLVCIGGNDDFCGLRSEVTFPTVAGQRYYVLVHGFNGTTGTFTLTRNCIPCVGVPSPGAITGNSGPMCPNTPVTLTLSGYTIANGITFQWRSSLTPGGPYTAILGATNNSYSFNATVTTYFIVSVTCQNGGGTGNTVEFPVRVSNLVHSNVLATPSTVCSPGPVVISGTVSGSAAAGNYTHSLTGPGTISAPQVSGANNSSVSFTVSNMPPGVHTYVLTSTDPIGCTVSTNVVVTVNQTPLITITTTPPASPGPCFENFDGVTAPGLPGGWSATVGVTCATSARWVTTTAVVNSAPNSAFANDPNCISDEYLNSKQYNITAASQLTFRRNNNLENTYDGMVLEISINGGVFVDVIAAGGSFVTGGYNATISSSFGSPISGRQAWTGNSGGWVTTTVNLPAAAIGQTIVLRWRRATDNSVAATGVYIDDISVTNAGCSAVTICNGTIVRIDATSMPPAPQTLTGAVNTIIPAGGTTSGIADPYPNTINVSGMFTSGLTVKSVTLNTFAHQLPDDVDIVLVAPNGQAVILMSDAGGNVPATGQTFVLDDAAAANLADNAFNASGTYKPTNYGAGDNWPAPGPGGAPSATTLSTFTGNFNGDWKLYVVDDAASNTGYILTWSITFNVPQRVVFSPTTSLFTDAAATIPYTGTPVYTVWAKPSNDITYTASNTSSGCSNSNSVSIIVNQLPTIITQPVALAAPVCPGFNVTYTVVASGTGLTYQWQVSTDGGATWNNILPSPNYSGITTASLTIVNAPVAFNNYRYRVIVSGTCAPPVTSNSVTLVVATPPTITSLTPAAPSVCTGGNITLTVVAAGVPAPNIYQWQVSTDGGATWTNLTTGGSFTPSFTITGATASMNNNRYRVIVTNLCGQSITSSVLILTVNTAPTVTATPLANRICLSDSSIQLVGSPVGGSWSGIGVSGFLFVPSVTAVGTYTLTYSYTSAAGCTGTATVIAKVEDCPERIRLLRDDAVILFPNPNNGRFNIRINSTLYNYLGMRVYTPAGQLVKVMSFNGLVYGRVVPIDIHDLPAGTYMVKFYYDDGIRTSEKTFGVVISR